MPDLAKLPLHDAIVKRVVVSWPERAVVFELLVFVDIGRNALPHRLEFTDVSGFSCPHESPWGESSYILEASGVAREFSLQMQSGDEIRILATGFSFASTGA